LVPANHLLSKLHHPLVSRLQLHLTGVTRVLFAQSRIKLTVVAAGLSLLSKLKNPNGSSRRANLFPFLNPTWLIAALHAMVAMVAGQTALTITLSQSKRVCS